MKSFDPVSQLLRLKPEQEVQLPEDPAAPASN
jgi:hypothetical protein